MRVPLTSAFVLYLAAVCIFMDGAVTQVTCSHPISACAGGSSTSNADLSSPLSGSGLTSMTSCITPLTNSNVAPAVVSSQAHRGVGDLSQDSAHLGSRPQVVKNTTSAKNHTFKITFASQNARSLTSEAKRQELLHACRSQQVYVAAVQETWMLKTEQLDDQGWLLLTHGPDSKICHHASHGLMFVLSPQARLAWQAAGAEVETSFGLRIMTMRLKLKDTRGKPFHVKVVNVYAPTSRSTDDEIDEFYTQLDRASKTNAGETLILTGDFNASLGTRLTTALPGEDRSRGKWGSSIRIHVASDYISG